MGLRKIRDPSKRKEIPTSPIESRVGSLQEKGIFAKEDWIKYKVYLRVQRENVI